jgi:hypothetical protein
MTHWQGKSTETEQIVSKGEYRINSNDLQRLYDLYIERGIRYYEFEEWAEMFGIKKVVKKSGRRKSN